MEAAISFLISTGTYALIFREEHANIEEYLRSKKLKIKNELLNEEMISYKEVEDSSSGNEYDNESQDDESEDEDFKEEQVSDVAEEFDEEYESEGSDSGEGPPSKKLKH